jgi:hypothetical protein
MSHDIPCTVYIFVDSFLLTHYRPANGRDCQDVVTRARKELQARGVKCWMDIDGGMQTDIYDSMAEGVQGAACVLCFMSKKPIVPVMMEPLSSHWKASDWLGVITA